MKQIKILLASGLPLGVLKIVQSNKNLVYKRIYKAHPGTVQLIAAEAKGGMTDEEIEKAIASLVERKKLVVK